MSESKNKPKNVALPAPEKSRPVIIQDLHVLDDKLGKLGEYGRKLLDLELKRDQKIAKTKEEYQARIARLKKSAANLFEAIVKYASIHRVDILPKDRKSVELTHGALGWRINPSAIKLKVKEDEAVAYLKKIRLGKYIRKVEVVDLEAIKKNPELARTLSQIVEYDEGGEFFFVKPAGVQLSFTRRMKVLVEKIAKTLSPKATK